MTRPILLQVASVLILIAAQQAYADSMSCSFTAQEGPSQSPLNVELDSFSWGASNPADVGAGGTGAGKAELSGFSFSNGMNSSYTSLLQLAASGTVFSAVSCGFYGPTTVGTVPSPYLTAVLTDAVLVGFEITGAGDGKQRAKFQFYFQNINWK